MGRGFNIGLLLDNAKGNYDDVYYFFILTSEEQAFPEFDPATPSPSSCEPSADAPGLNKTSPSMFEV